MPSPTKLQQKYAEQFLEDFKLQDKSPEVQERILAMVSERLSDLAVTVSISMMDEDQRRRFASALADPEKNQDEITTLTAEIPGLQEAIERAFLEEYDILKGSFVV